MKHPFLLQLDIASFFPSVKFPLVLTALEDRGASREVAALLAGLVTLPERLPQGAPTSVAVSDLVLGRLDGRLEGLARSRGLRYSRYVDDITLSGGSRLEKAEKLVRQIITGCGWTLNEKGGFFGPGDRHEVLGAIINVKPNVSQKYFGELRSLLRLASAGRVVLTHSEMAQLRGRVHWVHVVNPERGQRLMDLLKAAESLYAPVAGSAG